MITLEEFHKIQELLKDFMPVVSRIDRNVSRINRDVDKIFKDIEGECKGNTGCGTESNLLIAVVTVRE